MDRVLTNDYSDKLGLLRALPPAPMIGFQTVRKERTHKPRPHLNPSKPRRFGSARANSGANPGRSFHKL
jgi:hypothetical protein